MAHDLAVNSSRESNSYFWHEVKEHEVKEFGWLDAALLTTAVVLLVLCVACARGEFPSLKGTSAFCFIALTYVGSSLLLWIEAKRMGCFPTQQIVLRGN